MGFYVTGNRGTIVGPIRCNANDACMKLFQAMKGIGTDEEAVSVVISSHTFKMRQAIRKKYQQVYKKDLMKELSGELSGEFWNLVAALMTDPEDLILEIIHKAVVQQSRGGKIMKRISALFKDGLGKTEYSLLSMLCPRTNRDLKEIKESFNFKYTLDIEERIALGGNDLPSDFCSLVLDMLTTERDESAEVDEEQLEEDLDLLFEEGTVSEEAFHEFLIERSFLHLRQLFDRYMEESSETIEDFVEKSAGFSPEQKETYKGIVMLIVNEPAFYADRLKQAIQGAGTDDFTLVNITVLRSEVDLLDIMEAYENKFGISLADDVAGDTSGDYQDLLLKIIAVPPAEREEKKAAVRVRNRRGAPKQEEAKSVEETLEEKKARLRNRRRSLKKEEVKVEETVEKNQAKVQNSRRKAVSQKEEETPEAVEEVKPARVRKSARAPEDTVEEKVEKQEEDAAEEEAGVVEEMLDCKAEAGNEAGVVMENDEASVEVAEEATEESPPADEEGAVEQLKTTEDPEVKEEETVEEPCAEEPLETKEVVDKEGDEAKVDVAEGNPGEEEENVKVEGEEEGKAGGAASE